MKYHRPSQCERSQRSRERDECATRVSVEEGESLEWNNNDSTTQPEKGQLDKTSVVLKECRRAPSPRRQRSRVLQESASVEKTSIGGASREPLLPGNPRKPVLREAAVRAAFDADCRSGERELHCVFSSHLKNACRGARCPKSHRRSRSNKLVPA